MQSQGLANLASNDADFDRVPGLTRYARREAGFEGPFRSEPRAQHDWIRFARCPAARPAKAAINRRTPKRPARGSVPSIQNPKSRIQNRMVGLAAGSKRGKAHPTLTGPRAPRDRAPVGWLGPVSGLPGSGRSRAVFFSCQLQVISRRLRLGGPTDPGRLARPVDETLEARGSRKRGEVRPRPAFPGR